MPRSIWTGALSFGLVNVPVRLASAATDHDVRFRQLHDEDRVRVHTVRWCPEHQEIVPYQHIVRGFEISKDQYIPITDEELEALDPEKTRTIDIEEFVPAASIDPLYFDHPYYLVPDGEAAGVVRAYRLLVEALRDSQKLALGRFVLHSKEYIAAIRTFGDALVLHTMHFPDEIRPASELEDVLPGNSDVPKKDLQTVAKQIESSAAPFAPEKYRDFHQERIRALIEKKLEHGEDIAEQPAEAVGEPEEVPDLMAALERSLATSREKKDDREPSRDGAAAGRRSSKATRTKKPKETPKRRTKAR
jgi:DNA end-binding protein Ku